MFACVFAVGYLWLYLRWWTFLFPGRVDLRFILFRQVEVVRRGIGGECDHKAADGASAFMRIHLREHCTG